MASRWFLIRGIVQGVGYRFFATRAATRLGLSGFVRNLPDGSVEAVARGEERELQAFESCLKQGPMGSRVDSVETRDCVGEIPIGSFTVRG